MEGVGGGEVGGGGGHWIWEVKEVLVGSGESKIHRVV